MGAFPKQLLELHGKMILQHVIDSARQSQLVELTVVLGYQAATVRELIDEGPHARIIFNPRFQEGQSTSVRAGVRSISSTIDAAMILLGDQPGVTAPMIDQLIDFYAQRRPLLAVPCYSGKRGNPVIIDRSLFVEIQQLTGDTGAKSLFEKHLSGTEFLDFDMPSPPDIDTTEDYEAAKVADRPQAM